jgi:predicted small secreted protein
MIGVIIIGVVVAGVIILGGGNTISGIGSDVGKITGKNEMSSSSSSSRNVNNNSGYNGY